MAQQQNRSQGQQKQQQMQQQQHAIQPQVEQTPRQQQQPQGSSLISRSWYPRSLLQSTLSRFPGFWEDMENGLAELTQDSSNLSLYDDDKNIIVEAALPGLQSDQINITLDRGLLRIWGEKEESEDGKKFLRRAVSSYSYRMQLPEEIDERTEPQATFKNGVVILTFPKRAETQAKKIQISKS
jgi:HSP20 family protein